MGDPNSGCLLVENPIEMDDDWGYPQLWKPPHANIGDGVLLGLPHYGRYWEPIRGI